LKNVIDHIGYFKDTRKELKENAYFNLFLLCFILVLRISEIQKGGVFYNTVTIQQIKHQFWNRSFDFVMRYLNPILNK